MNPLQNIWVGGLVWFMVFNATLSNISFMSWRSDLNSKHILHRILSTYCNIKPHILISKFPETR